MKTIMMIIAIAFVFNMNAQDLKTVDVPAAIKDAFTKQYPGAKNTEWEKENGNFEAEFKLNGVETSALFEASGKFLQSETEIKITELPTSVTDYVKSSLAGKKIKEAAKITQASGAVSYEAEVDKIDYIFDANGAFLKKEVETDNDMDGNKD